MDIQKVPFIKDICMSGSMEAIIGLKNKVPLVFKNPETHEPLFIKAKEFVNPDFQKDGYWKSEDVNEQRHQLECLNAILMLENISEINRMILSSWMITEMAHTSHDIFSQHFVP